MYLECVLLWPDDGCFTAELRRPEVNYKILSYYSLYMLCFLDSNKYQFKK